MSLSRKGLRQDKDQGNRISNIKLGSHTPMPDGGQMIPLCFFLTKIDE
jgi:hypothetical protein